MNEKKSLGPLKAVGLLLGTIGTTIEAIDNIVTRSADLIDIGFDAIEIPTNNMLADLKCDSIVDDARRDSRIATARAEADAIRASVKPKPQRAPRANKATSK